MKFALIKNLKLLTTANSFLLMFVCVEDLWPSQPDGVMSTMVSLPNYTYTRQA